MSAILGFSNLDGRPAEEERLARMSDRLAHRGSEGSGLRLLGPAGLAHRMRHATPESRSEIQPLSDNTGRLWLVWEGRVDNRDELRRALRSSKVESDDDTDGTLILSAYQAWGKRCPERILGDFAFAIWDAHARSFFCARDAVGVKPFYYYYCPGKLFAFASEIKGLLAHPEIPQRLNEAKVGDYLNSLLEDKIETFYRDVRRLPPAHTMRVTPEGIRTERYWSLDPRRELRLGSDEEYAAAFRETFQSAVACRLRSDRPIGSLLSGGLDSSSITCMAARLRAAEGAPPVKSFSAVYDHHRECDERSYIQAAVASGGIEPHTVTADALGPLSDIDLVLRHEDEPFQFPNLFIQWALYAAARREGVGTLLEGFDGDTAVSHGVGFLVELARSGRWIRLWKEMRGFSDCYEVSLRRVFRHGVVRSLAPQAVKRLWRELRGRSGEPRRGALRSDFFHRAGVAARIRAQQRWPVRSEREDHVRELDYGGQVQALEVLDRAGAAFSLDLRFPFLDRRLLEFCVSLPPEQKVRRGWTRHVLRRGLEGILPDPIRWRPGKARLNRNFEKGLLGFERQRLEDTLLRRPGRLGEFVDLPAIRKSYNDYARQGYGPQALPVWQSVVLGLWLEDKGSLAS